MPQFRLEKIIKSDPNAYQGLTKTWFITDGATVYLFHKPENAPREGETLDGTIAPDRGSQLKFTKTKLPLPVGTYDNPGVPQPVSVTQTSNGTTAQLNKVYRADPDKMKQEFTLDVAKNKSIMRQVAVKAAVDLMVADKAVDLVETYVDIMELLSEPQWQVFKRKLDQPPIEMYDKLPTDEEVLSAETDLDKAFAEHLREE